jgi:hypothetical protein
MRNRAFQGAILSFLANLPAALPGGSDHAPTTTLPPSTTVAVEAPTTLPAQ